MKPSTLTKPETWNAPSTEPYAQRAYKRSRRAYSAECMFEYFVSILVTDAFLTSLLEHIGISDSTIGIISSIISLAFLFQLLSLYAVRRIVNTKRAAILFHFTSQLFFMSLYLVPFLPLPTKYKTVIVVGCRLLAYFGNYLVTVIIYKWGMSYVDPTRRARFSATKEMVSLLSGMVFTLVMGYGVDKFAAAGNVKGGFIFVAAAILASSLLDLTCLITMKNRALTASNTPSEPVLRVVRHLLRNKSFIYIIVITVLWNIATYFTIGFMGIYKTKDLALTVGTIQVINTAGCLARFAVSRPFGKYSDKHSYASGLCLGFTVAAVAFGLNVFTTPDTWWMVVIFTVLYQTCMAGVFQNLTAICFDFVEDRYFVQATAIRSAIGGIFGFLASLAGGRIVALVQANGNRLLGFEMRAQQLLSLMSALTLVGLILFVKLVFSKQKKLTE